MSRWFATSVAALLLWAQAATAAPPAAAVLHIDGPIGPATAGYFDKAMRQAQHGHAPLVVLEIDTPGGLESSMRDIVRDIMASPVPVIGYVAPSGARAASAGTYILYATHIAAMAPATNIGAATPIPAGGDWAAPGRGEAGKPGSDKTAPEATPPAGLSAEEVKAVNDAVAFIRSLAETRGRNADWAEHAVREGASLSAEKALQEHVIDLMAPDVDALLKAVDGRSVPTAAGTVVLHSAGLVLHDYRPDWRMQLLGVITNPTIAYVLILAGIYGLLLEGYHPGATLPGVVGGICLVLGLYAMHLLPVNYAGLGLILLGVALMVAEVHAPSFGALGFGGIVAFVLGSVMLMDADVPGYGIHLGVVAGIALCAAALIAITLYLIWRARRAPTVTGSQGLVGQTAEILEAVENGKGWARVQGERWRVRCAQPLPVGAQARVRRMDGLVLDVEPL